MDRLSYRNYIRIEITEEQYKDLLVLYARGIPLRTPNPERLPRFLHDLDLIECLSIGMGMYVVKVISDLAVHPYFNGSGYVVFLPLSV